jgi:hypothetical protein
MQYLRRYGVHAQIQLRNCTFKIKDGGGKSLAIKVGDGNLTYTEKRTIEYTRDRGILDEVRQGDEEPMDVSFDFQWDYIVGDDPTPSVEEAIKGIGLAETAGWVSSDSDACRPYAVDLEITNSPTPSGCGDIEVITLPDFRWENLPHDVKAGSISCTGKCNAMTASASRGTTTPTS